MSDYIARALRRLTKRVTGVPGSATDVSIETLRTRQALLVGAVTTHAQITADQDDYTLGDRGRHRLSSDATWSITGFEATTNELLPETLWNVGSEEIVIKHQDTGSIAENRVICQGSADIHMGPNDAVDLEYDGVVLRWRAALR